MTLERSGWVNCRVNPALDPTPDCFFFLLFNLIKYFTFLGWTVTSGGKTLWVQLSFSYWIISILCNDIDIWGRGWGENFIFDLILGTSRRISPRHTWNLSCIMEQLIYSCHNVTTWEEPRAIHSSGLGCRVLPNMGKKKISWYFRCWYTIILG